MDRFIYAFNGELKTVTDITVTRTCDKFGKDDISRIPRTGKKDKSSQSGYFPTGSFTSKLRRATSDVLRYKMMLNSENPYPFDLATKFLQEQGMLLGTEKRNQAANICGVGNITPGLIDKFRKINPAISMHGYWQLNGTWSIDNLYADENENPIQERGVKYRQNQYIKSPEQVQSLSEDDQQWLTDVLSHDRFVVALNKSDKASIKEMEGLLKSTESPEEKVKIRQQIAEAKQADKDKKIKNANEANAFDNSIMHPVAGYEVIERNSSLAHRMWLRKSNDLELGLALATLRQFSVDPQVGGHGRDGCGMLSGEYKVTKRNFMTCESEVLGWVIFGEDEFGFKGESEKLEKILADFDEIALDFEKHGIDLSAAGIAELES